jgi:predicted dehydrogenase
MKIKIGIIGCKRGQKIIEIIKKTNLDLEVVAACDNDKIMLKKLSKQHNGIKTFISIKSFFSYKNMNAVYIASPVKFHAQQTILAAKNKKNILCEVPAFKTIQEGKRIFNELKKNNTRYMLAENYCFLPQNLALNKLIKKKSFGNINFIRTSYIHDCRRLSFDMRNGKLTWRGIERKKNNGNDYPTHSIGPVCKFLELNNDSVDELKYITSFSNNEMAMSNMYFNIFPKNKKSSNFFKRPDTSFSILETKKKKIIELICDTTSARPSSMSDLYIQGTKMTYISGRFDGERPIISSTTKSNNSKTFKPFLYEKCLNKDDLRLYKLLGKSFAFYKVLKNFRDVLKNKVKKPYIDFKDAFLWSSIIELSKISLINKSKKIKINKI